MIKSTVFMTMSTIARLLTGVILFVWMARVWGAATFGLFIYPFTVTSLAVMLVDYGFTLQLVRDIGRAPKDVQAALHGKLGAKVLLTVLLVLGALAFTPNLMSGGYARSLTWLLLLAAILNSFGVFLNLPFRGLGRFQEETKVVVLSNVVHFLVVGLIVGVGGGPVAAALGFVASRALYFVMSLFAYQHIVGAVDWRGLDFRGIPRELASGLPFGVFVALGTIYFQIDTILIQRFLGAQAVGFYQAAVRILMAALVLPDVLSNVYLPALASSASDPRTSVRLGTRLTRHLLMFGVLGLAALGILGGWMTGVLYGSEYQVVSALLPFLGVVLLLRFLASSYGLLLTVADRQLVRTLIVASTCLVSISFNLILIPRAGLRGAVTASIFTHLFLVLTYLVFVARAYGTIFLDWRSWALIFLGAVVVLVGREIHPTSAVIAVIVLCAISIGLKWSEIRGLAQRLTPHPVAIGSRQ